MIIVVASGVGAEEGVGGVGCNMISSGGCCEIESVVGPSQFDGTASIDNVPFKTTLLFFHRWPID